MRHPSAEHLRYAHRLFRAGSTSNKTHPARTSIGAVSGCRCCARPRCATLHPSPAGPEIPEGSGCFLASSAMRSSVVEMFPKFSGSVIVPSLVSLPRLPRPSTGFPWGGFPAFVGTMGSLDFPRCFPPRSVSFAGRHLACALSSSLPCARTRLARAWALFRKPPLFPLREEGAGSPRFLGNLHIRAPVFDPGGAPAPGLLVASVLPSVTITTSASTSRNSRDSIPRPACSLSTLRSQGRPCTTQDSLPVGDQPYRAGFYPPRRVPLEGLSNASFHQFPPPPSFPGAR
jgi:hypothetical protein